MHDNSNGEKIFPLHLDGQCDVDDFCIPEEHCPDIIETPKFPSPNSCLPPMETEELEARIDEANRLLLNLGLSNELEDEGRRRALEGLVGQFVRINIDCLEEEVEAEATAVASNNTLKPKVKKERKVVKRNGKVIKIIVRKRKIKPKPVKQNSRNLNPPKQQKFIEGWVKLVGRDFVILVNKDKEHVIRLSSVGVIKTVKGMEIAEERPELLNIDPCLRRALTFNFGETVASSPELIHIFFRLTFNIYLLLLEGKKVKVRLADEAFVATIVKVQKESIALKLEKTKGKETIRELPLETICFLTNLECS